MTPIAIILSLLGILMAASVTVWATLRGERRSREASDKNQIEQVERLLQSMVVDKIDAAFAEISKLQKRTGNVERSHDRMMGFLQGKGCIVPDICPDDTKESGL